MGEKKGRTGYIFPSRFRFLILPFSSFFGTRRRQQILICPFALLPCASKWERKVRLDGMGGGIEFGMGTSERGKSQEASFASLRSGSPLNVIAVFASQFSRRKKKKGEEKCCLLRFQKCTNPKDGNRPNRKGRGGGRTCACRRWTTTTTPVNIIVLSLVQ